MPVALVGDCISAVVFHFSTGTPGTTASVQEAGMTVERLFRTID